MDKVKQVLRNAPLGFIDLLTKVFKYFKVHMEVEECIEVVDTMINN